MRLSGGSSRRLAAIALALALGAGAAVGAGVGCGSDGVTPNCSLPDGAFNPESGCGQLVEAAAPEDATGEAAPSPLDSGGDVLPGLDAADASDTGPTTSVDAADGGPHEGGGDGGEGGGPTDAHHDGAG